MRQSQGPPQGKFKVKCEEPKELYLHVLLDEDDTYVVYRRLSHADQSLRDSVLKVDYKYTPWPRFDGNLLWQ